MESVSTAITTALGFVGEILNYIVSNTILCVIFAAGVFVPLAVKVFKRIKNAAKR